MASPLDPIGALGTDLTMEHIRAAGGRPTKEDEMTDDRTAPVQAIQSSGQTILAGRIPWALHMVAWRAYRDAGHGDQSAEQIAKRGGFGWVELLAALRGEYNFRGGLQQSRHDLYDVEDGG
ncbi:hypothetical protein LCGC14_1292800 [marine sediment metagenome]|uniref:Uncharacterized protein n=1 Tax=marine sediment metagenome TaxID=412755 RepID=A0A0F9NUT9_9ZZZZ